MNFEFFTCFIITEQIRNILDFWETGIFFGKPCTYIEAYRDMIWRVVAKVKGTMTQKIVLAEIDALDKKICVIVPLRKS